MLPVVLVDDTVPAAAVVVGPAARLGSSSSPQAATAESTTRTHIPRRDGLPTSPLVTSSDYVSHPNRAVVTTSRACCKARPVGWVHPEAVRMPRTPSETSDGSRHRRRPAKRSDPAQTSQPGVHPP